MVEPLSALGSAFRPGSHGNFAHGEVVNLSETQPGSIIQASGWRGQEKALIAAIGLVTGLELPDGAGGGIARDTKHAFGIAPGRFLVADQSDGLAAELASAVDAEIGTVTDLSHARTALRISGVRSEWVLSKLFALDFSLPAFPLGAGRATVHHDILAQIQRTGDAQFDLYVFRSFARSFWKVLGHAADEMGYVVK